MKGATALDCENTISRPKRTKTTTIGTSQYFFSCRRNIQNSERTRPLLIQPSIHARVMLSIAIPGRIRRPSRRGRGRPPACERILAEEPPHHPERHEDDDEEQREQHAGVEVADHERDSPPPDARPRQRRRRDAAEDDQRGTDGADDFGAQRMVPPVQPGGKHTEHRADREAERSFTAGKVALHGLSSRTTGRSASALRSFPILVRCRPS